MEAGFTVNRKACVLLLRRLYKYTIIHIIKPQHQSFHFIGLCAVSLVVLTYTRYKYSIHRWYNIIYSFHFIQETASNSVPKVRGLLQYFNPTIVALLWSLTKFSFPRRNRIIAMDQVTWKSIQTTLSFKYPILPTSIRLPLEKIRSFFHQKSLYC